MADLRPIGMLDSGVGGLSVLRQVRAILPSESILYFADEGHLPYGPRQREEIQVFVEGIARFLIAQGCKMIVIACNTANAAALHYLRSVITDIPIVGMEPAIKPAVEHTQTGVVGVIMTRVTYQSELFASVMERFARDVQVVPQVCPELVLLAERGAPDDAPAQKIIAACLEPIKAAHADQLVLACTHFPFLTPQIQRYLGPAVTIIDPAPAVARQVARVLDSYELTNETQRAGEITYFSSGDTAHFGQLLGLLSGQHNAAIQPAYWDRAAVSLLPAAC